MKHLQTLSTTTSLPVAASLLESTQKANILNILATAFNTYTQGQDRKEA